jgi:hypothetical protein
VADGQFLEALEAVRKKYYSRGDVTSAFNPIQTALVSTGDALPPWWSVLRDRKLYEMMLKSDHLSGLAYTALTKLANIPLQFLPRDRTVTSQVDRAIFFGKMVRGVSEGGEGLRMAMKRFILDYLVTDNGGFMEVMGDGPEDGPILGMPWGVRHLSSLRSRRTGDQEYPVAYVDRDDKRYKLHSSRVIYMSQMSMGLTQKSGVGLGSVSRSHLLGEVLTGQILYKLEKMGRRPGTKVFVGDNITPEQMIAAFMAANKLQDNLGLQHFGMNVYIGGNGVELDSHDLNNFDPFDEEVGTLMAMYAIAFAWGLKIQDIWPVGGSKASEQISNMQSRGRLPIDFINDLQEQLEFKLCPPYIRPVFLEQDDEQEMMQANIADIRSRSVERLAQYEILDTSAHRRIMLEDQAISREEFVRQQLADGMLEDGSPVATLFYSDDKVIRTLLLQPGESDPLHFESNDPTLMVAWIHVQMAECYKIMAAGSQAQKRRAQEAYAALKWLAGEYEKIAMAQIRQDTEAEDEEEQGKENDEQEEVPTEE